MHIRQVNYNADQALLAEVYAWAESNRAAYLDGTAYRSFADFLTPPEHSTEFLVFLGDQLAALLTFIRLPMAAEIYQVGLISSPEISKRQLVSLLQQFKPKVFAYAQALIVSLPCEMRAARKLARKFGFSPLNQTDLILFKD